jgi:hypothetical protein
MALSTPTLRWWTRAAAMWRSGSILSFFGPIARKSFLGVKTFEIGNDERALNIPYQSYLNYSINSILNCVIFEG